MTISTDTVDAVAAACRDRLGDPSAWVASDAYRQSLALCIIESVQSTSGHSEVTVVDRYLAYRKAREDKPVTDGARELLRTFEEAGSSDQWAGKIGSYKRRYTATGVPIEARHIQQVAEKLHHLRSSSRAPSVRAACGSSTTTSSQRFASRKENSSPSNATSEPNWNGGRISCARGGPRFPSTDALR